MRRLVILLTGLALAITGLASCNEALAQGVTPTAEQLDMFRNLSPEQQQAILQQLTGGLGAQGSLGALGSLGGPRQDQASRGALSEQSNLDRLGGIPSTGEPPEPSIPVLKGEDSVVIEIDFPLPPRSASTAPASAAAQAPAIAAAQQSQSQPQPQSRPQAEMEPTDDEKARLKDLITLIRSKNPYTLSLDGVLYLPGFAGIPLAGLIEDLATLRLKVEPAFRNLDVRVTKLPLKKTGAEALKPFGYDLFLRSPSTFAPVTNVPVPADYVVGAGDELNVQLYGNVNRSLLLIVGRDGRVNLPEIGPINVGGQRFTAVQSAIASRVARQMLGVRASISMGDTRAIRVFVLGDANRPGSYTISGLGTITSALFAAGGVKPIGSLRNIQLKRQSTVIRRLDLYDMLIRGDTTDDTKLLPGDVIFIPPVGPTVGVDGEVRRPAIYEIKNETSVADVVQLAGGLTPEADTSKATLTRIDEVQHRVVVSVDLSAAATKGQGVHNGDLLRVTRLRPTLDSGILVQGYVYSPSTFAYRQGLRLSDIIPSVDDLKPNADIHYVLIRRELPPDRRVTVLSADLGAALTSRGSGPDVELMPRDRILVFDLASGRDRAIQPVLDELRLQGNSRQPTEVVHIDGRVKAPGEYPLETGMTVSDLIRAGGGLSDEAYGGKAELTRYKVVNGETRRTELIDVDLAVALRGDPAVNIKLNPFDTLSIKEVPEWQVQEGVILTGEVRFPGRYSIRRGETLKSVIARAGGLTDYAFAEGSVFTREELKRREQEQMDMLADRMQRDLTLFALQGAAAGQGGAGTALAVGQSLLSQLRTSKAVGRLVIDLPRTLRASAGSATDVVLRGGDRLIVPKFQQQVTVIGEVQNSTSLLYSSRFSREDYISASGGMTRRADQKKIYVVHANGSVVADEGSRWFQRRGSQTPIKPGDTIVVPLDAERMPPLPFWLAVTQILYNVAIAAAAVHAL
jgi:protein involved in polysaccharide export with SLBB domain